MKKIIIFILGIHLVFVFSQTQKPFFLPKEAEISYLYRNCLNDLWLYTPDICEGSPIEIKVSGATFWQDSTDKRHIKINPSGNKVNIEIYYYDRNKKVVYWQKLLSVLEIPGFYYHFEVDGNPRYENNRIDKKSKITFLPSPDANFAQNMPNECDYRLESLAIYASAGDKPPLPIKTMNFDIHKPQGEITIPLPESCFEMGKDTRIFIEIGEVYRMNGQGKLVHEFFRCTLYERIGVFYVK